MIYKTYGEAIPCPHGLTCRSEYVTHFTYNKSYTRNDPVNVSAGVCQTCKFYCKETSFPYEFTDCLYEEQMGLLGIRKECI